MPPSSRQPEERRDLEACVALLRAGSKSFAMASLLLPRPLREATAPVYAFCRVADDAIDAPDRASGALASLSRRLDRVVRGSPIDHPVDRALARVMADHSLPREPFDALLEGFAWDVEGRRYETLADLGGYAARVAGTVGVIMTRLMSERQPHVLARACDLGVAMQLTNIARDVGEDARAGRVYLPLEWLDRTNLGVSQIAQMPAASAPVRELVERLLTEADALYGRADSGIALLPRRCRPAIRSARLIYSDLHRVIRARGHDTVGARAHVSGMRKLALVARAFLTHPEPGSDAFAPPLEQASFLCRSAAHA